MKINPTKPTSVSAYIAACQYAACISDQHISDALGFKNPSVFESIKQGKVKLPFALVQKLADVLSIDASELLRKVMQEYMPEVCSGQVISDTSIGFFSAIFCSKTAGGRLPNTECTRAQL